ncbi:MAG: DUF885 family protein, partial [Anaerolineae bacterium]
LVKLWDVASGDELRTFLGHTDNVHNLLFSPGGDLLASTSRDGTVQVWSVEHGQALHVFDLDGEPTYGLAFSPDGALLASSGRKGTVALWRMADGASVGTLAGHRDLVLSLAFSPDGTLLASAGVDPDVLVWGIPAAGSAAGAIAAPKSVVEAAQPLRTGAALGPAGDNGTIAFTSYRDGEAKIYAMHPDGSGVTPLSRTGLRDTRPTWSPDGQRVAFVRRLGQANHELFVMNADGSGATRLTDLPDSVESEPAWSPDGTRLAFISNQRLSSLMVSGRFHVWVMNADGSDPRLLADLGGTNASPDWSPDGRRIAFDSNRDGNYEIYLIDADGCNPVNLTAHPGNDVSPAWSPDGARIAFVSDRSGDQEIYVMDADGTNVTRLTFVEGYDKSPAWSPDGEYLVFYGMHDAHNTEVYRIRADGTELVQLTAAADFDGFPTWQATGIAPAAGSVAEGPAAAPGSPVDEATAALEGLPIDAFFDESFRLLMLRDPEWVTAEGLDARFGTAPDRLTPLDDAYVRDTQALEVAMLALLRAYDRDALDPDQQISYDVYEWYLADRVRGHDYTYYDYPVTHFVTGVQYDLLQLFTDLHPIATPADAEAYVARLSEVDDKFEGLVEGLHLRAGAGVVLPRFLFPWLMGDIRGLARAPARFTPFYSAFEEKVAALENLGDADKQALLDAAEAEIEASVVPAFAALEDALVALQSEAPGREGVWQFPDGDGYYRYLLHHFTTTDMTPAEIEALGRQELARVHDEMRAAFAALGYPAGESIPELYARLARDSGTVSGSRAADAYEAILRDAEANLDDAFDLRPRADLVVVAGAQGDYYVSGSLDGTRPGAFYARIDGGGTLAYGMPTLAYHEGVPGHHFQIALAQESDLPLFRNVLVFLGYAEGWALYAEQLAYELGWYDDDPYGNLGRLRDQAFRAARLVVDTGIHERGWTFDEAHAFMVENVGRDPGMLEFEVSRYIAWPGQATAYMVGMLQIQALRRRAMDALGDRFDLKDFHRVVLSNGSMPLEVLERVVDDYIAATLQEE